MKKLQTLLLIAFICSPCAASAQSKWGLFKWITSTSIKKEAQITLTSDALKAASLPRYSQQEVINELNAGLDMQLSIASEFKDTYNARRVSAKDRNFLRRFYRDQTTVLSEMNTMNKNIERLQLRKQWIPKNLDDIVKEMSSNLVFPGTDFDYTSAIPNEPQVLFFGESLHDESLYRDVFKKIVKQYKDKGAEVIIASEFVLQRLPLGKGSFSPCVYPNGASPQERFQGLYTFASYRDVMDFAYKNNIPLIPLEDPAFSRASQSTPQDKELIERFAKTNEGITRRNQAFLRNISLTLQKHPKAKILVLTGAEHSRKVLNTGESLFSMAKQAGISSYVIELTGGRYGFNNQPAAPLLRLIKGQDRFFLTSFNNPEFSLVIGADMYINVPFSGTRLYEYLKSPEQLKKELEIEQHAEPMIRYFPSVR